MRSAAPLRIFLTLVLALWSAGQSARAAVGVAVEICAADGPRTIVFDADGAPVPADPDCERCLLCAGLAAAGPQPASRSGRRRARRTIGAGAAPGRRAWRGRRARAPPGARPASS